MTRVVNFGAGPATLPEPVFERARDELLDWGDAGMSVMEMSRRGPQFRKIAEAAEHRLRGLLVRDDLLGEILAGTPTMLDYKVQADAGSMADTARTFLEEAKAAGLEGLKGHRSVGGMRASLYNAMSVAGVDALIEFMQYFEKRRG